MPITIIRSPPDEALYTSLSAYQAETPSTFNTPVLHFRHDNCKIIVSREDYAKVPIFGQAEPGEDDIPDVQALSGFYCWVTSEKLIIFNPHEPPSGLGMEIPYPILTLHAVKRNVASEIGIYLQISLTPDVTSVSNTDNHDDDDLVEITVLPAPGNGQSTDEIMTRDLFKALSDCAALHPGPVSSDDDDEDRIIFEEAEYQSNLEEFLGEGGWITAENVDQFRFDDADEPTGTILGPGAGITRSWEEGGSIKNGVDDVAIDDKEYQETKWRRTG